MENLVYVLKLMKKYNWYYFIKNALRKNTARKILGVFLIMLFLSFILIPFIMKPPYSFYILWSGVLTMFLILYFIFWLIDKDYEHSINQPLTMKFLSGDYLILRIQAVKETLQKENLLNEIFLNDVLEECERYLILENNGVSFALKHPLMTLPIAIISAFFGSLLWEVRLHAPLTVVMISFMTYMLLVISPFLKNRFAQVRTLKFILQTLKKQMKKSKKSDLSYLGKLPPTSMAYNVTTY